MFSNRYARKAAIKILAFVFLTAWIAGCQAKPRSNPIDGMIEVYIPAGRFTMGGGDAPEHEVYLDAYWISQTPITNAMYAHCDEMGACPGLSPYYYGPTLADHPVIYITWSTAARYCEWSGGRLPTEAEWEKAARGTDGRKYPWGNDKPNRGLVNLNKFNPGTVSVGSYPGGASPFGVLDMGSNVREWVADWYEEGYVSPEVNNPTGPVTGELRVLRGGAWSDALSFAVVTHRLGHDPNSAGVNRGFRCVYAP